MFCCFLLFIIELQQMVLGLWRTTVSHDWERSYTRPRNAWKSLSLTSYICTNISITTTRLDKTITKRQSEDNNNNNNTIKQNSASSQQLAASLLMTFQFFAHLHSLIFLFACHLLCPIVSPLLSRTLHLSNTRSLSTLRSVHYAIGVYDCVCVCLLWVCLRHHLLRRPLNGCGWLRVRNLPFILAYGGNLNSCRTAWPNSFCGCCYCCYFLFYFISYLVLICCKLGIVIHFIIAEERVAATSVLGVEATNQNFQPNITKYIYQYSLT